MCQKLSTQIVRKILIRNVPKKIWSKFEKFSNRIDRKMTQNVWDIVEPLRAIAKADRRSAVVSSGEKRPFEEVKRKLEDLEDLTFYSKTNRTIVFADASSYALGAVLIQMRDAQTPQIVSYASKTLNHYEKKLSQTEKEA